MRGYRDLFQREFGSEKRLRDIREAGLPLGIETVEMEEAFAVLQNGGKSDTDCENAEAGNYPKNTAAETEKVRDFIKKEIQSILLLRDMLTGKQRADSGQVEDLLDECDYLWAHFPDCAGTGGRRPPGTDLSFLKRVRIEIDPFIKIWTQSLSEINRPWS
jgi:hypothetical protein